MSPSDPRPPLPCLPSLSPPLCVVVDSGDDGGDGDVLLCLVPVSFAVPSSSRSLEFPSFAFDVGLGL